MQVHRAESLTERLNRIVPEHVLISNLGYCDKIYRDAIEKKPSAELKYNYSLFCLKNNLKNVEDIVNDGGIEEYLQQIVHSNKDKV